MKKIKIILIIAICLICFGSGMMLVSKMEFSSKSELTTSGVLERVKAVSQLNTVEMYFNEIIDYSDSKYFNEMKLPFTTKSFIFTVKARVKAGVDLSQLKEKDIELEDGYIRIILPKPIVTSKEILEYKAYDEQDGLFNEVTNEDTLGALEEFNGRLEKQALESGILEKAQTNAETALKNVLMMAGFEEIEVAFK